MAAVPLRRAPQRGAGRFLAEMIVVWATFWAKLGRVRVREVWGEPITLPSPCPLLLVTEKPRLVGRGLWVWAVVGLLLVVVLVGRVVLLMGAGDD